MHTVTAQRGRPVSAQSQQVYGNMDRQTELLEQTARLQALVKYSRQSFAIDQADNEIQRLIIQGLRDYRATTDNPEHRMVIDGRIAELEAALAADLRDDPVKRESISTLQQLLDEGTLAVETLRIQNRIMEGRAL